MNDIDWDFIVLEINDGVPYYLEEKDALAKFQAYSNIKHLAMLQTLFYGCLRRSELCRLEDNDIDIRARTLRLLETKGGHDAIVYINEECAETLRLYLKIRSQIRISDKYWFSIQIIKILG